MKIKENIYFMLWHMPPRPSHTSATGSSKKPGRRAAISRSFSFLCIIYPPYTVRLSLNPCLGRPKYTQNLHFGRSLWDNIFIGFLLGILMSYAFWIPDRCGQIADISSNLQSLLTITKDFKSLEQFLSWKLELMFFSLEWRSRVGSWTNSRNWELENLDISSCCFFLSLRYLLILYFVKVQWAFAYHILPPFWNKTLSFWEVAK